MWREGSVCEPLSVPKRSAEDQPPRNPRRASSPALSASPASPLFCPSPLLLQGGRSLWARSRPERTRAREKTLPYSWPGSFIHPSFT